MEFSCDWLAQYVDLPAHPQELAKALTAAGLAVEGESAHGDDTVLDIDVTTNRPDCMNHFGLAREIAVLYGTPLRRPPASPTEDAEKNADAARVTIDDLEGCPRFTGRVVRGVTIGPSPEWLRRRLESIGLRPINNVVDVTNFILWELGQPLHAYDFAKLAGGQLIVRRARAGEKLITLDGVDRELDPEILVIADAERPVGLGGVMGGLESEVTAETRDIFIEGAHFDRKRVRATAKRQGMHTDASHRFERGADPEICDEAVSRAALLIAEIAGGTVLAGVLDERDPAKTWSRQGRLDLKKLDAFAGAAIDPADSERWLTGLGFGVDRSEGGVWGITVPSWRYFDFQPRPEPPHEVYPQDVYEEVLRVFGLDRIPAALPGIPGADAPRAETLIRRDRIRRQLAASGYTEAVHFAFLDPARDAAFPSLKPEAKPIRLANPISEQLSVLRRSLVPSLVDTARFNQRRGLAAVRMFEIANAFYERPEGGIPDQPEHVSLVCGGRLGSPWEREVELDLFDLKGALDALFDAFGVRLEARPAELVGVLPGNSAELLRGGEVVGWFGRVAEEEGYPLYAAEIATAALAGGDISLQVDPPSRYPGVSADFTFTQSLETPWAEIEGLIRELAPPDLVSWQLKDRYRGSGVPEGAVNTTLSFHYNARERSLTQEEVNARQGALNQELERRFGWKG
ncbi:MAG TPA: phenylalanine--tRNA ligase subunit beta [Thermoanaerobaculia bacterium]|jgi:phenylalanyl-tRNA synthetase beta chain|nr:phenylalanine--tRNA ligase subunit beta [Thermoanaerobaculia bacterium]